MKVSVEGSGRQGSKADVLIVPFWKGARGSVPAWQGEQTFPIPEGAALRHDFVGKRGQAVLLYPSKGQAARVLFLGLGTADDATAETIRSGYAVAIQACREGKFSSVAVVVPSAKHLDAESIGQAVVEGCCLANYSFSAKEKQASEVSSLVFLGATKDIQESLVICEAVHRARDMVNANADDATPAWIAAQAVALAKTSPKLKATVFDKKRIEKEGMGLLLAVGRGASVDPRFILVEYRGNPKARDHTVFVGKGVTFDTGGLDIKPAASMERQRTDMAGAATVLCALQAIAKLKLKVNITVVIPSAENSIGSRAYKPGDVYPSYSGKSVEIGNTDAEGRLILADALSYVVKRLKPTQIVDVATLTGAIVTALGDEVTGLLSNNDALAQRLIEAGETTYERLWRLPLVEEYRTQLKSDRADLRNVGGGGAGSIIAALFLQTFVENVPWAHLDIAGTRFLTEARRYHPKGATGVGVRLLVEFARRLM